jgi:putative transposase
MVFHVLNRGVARMQLFETMGDFQAFVRVLEETRDETPMRICADALMPNYWYLLLWPERDGELATFMQRLSITHVLRWQEHRHDVGLGHVDRGRYKSFPVESDEHFRTVARYVERIALRANLMRQAEKWRWSSLRRRAHGTK